MKRLVPFALAALVACKAPPPTPAPKAPAGPQRVTLTEEGVRNANIKVERVNAQTFAPRLSVVATIEPDPKHHAQIGPRVAGRVAAINVRLGDTVKKGQTLVEIEAVETHLVAAEYLTALARAREANDALERQKKLIEERVGAVADLRRAEANAEAANASMRESEEHLGFLGLSNEAIAQIRAGKLSAAERSFVRTPIDGTVSMVRASLGQVLGGTEVLVTIVDAGALFATLRIYERDLPGLEVGAPVEVKVPGYPGRVFKGTLSVLGASVDEKTRTVEALAKLEDSAGLRPGMTATASVLLTPDGKTLWLPAEAVQRNGVERIVFVKVGERDYEVRTVAAGPERSGFVPVTSGLSSDTEVVVQGAFALRGELGRAEAEAEGE